MTWIAPTPISRTSAAAIPIPTATPIESSTARRRGWPRESPSEMTAAAGAKKGCGWPTISFASAQATPAARADWRIAGQAPETCSSRTRVAPRTRCSRAQSRVGIEPSLVRRQARSQFVPLSGTKCERTPGAGLVGLEA